MMRATFLTISTLLALAACAPAPVTVSPTAVLADGKPAPKVYRIGPGDTSSIQFRMLDSVNALRAASGAPAVTFDSRLNAAAATHARDMSVQNRPWLFGSDGSSPIDRMERVGYAGRYVGETISESYETETETLAAWMESEDTRRILLDPKAGEMGFAWYQEPNGKIWWNLVLGAPDMAPVRSTGPA